jgi:hypothetical protein
MRGIVLKLPVRQATIHSEIFTMSCSMHRIQMIAVLLFVGYCGGRSMAAEPAVDALLSQQSQQVVMASDAAEETPNLNAVHWLSEQDNTQIVPVSGQFCGQCGDDSSLCDCGAGDGCELWDGQFEVGLNGAEGNSRNVNLVVGFDAKYEEGLDSLILDYDYLFNRDEDEVTKNRFFSQTRYIHDIPDSDWGYFVDNWFEWDDLESFRARYGLHAGGIRTFVDTDEEVLKGLIGLGTSKEFAGTDQNWKPEAFLGGLWEKNIADRQKCYIKGVYYPDVNETKSFRVNVKAGWEYTLSREKDIKLSLSAFDRYDSTPSEDDLKNNIDYWASVVWGF